MFCNHTLNYQTAFTVEPLPDSQVKLTGELPYAELASERTAALTALGRDVAIDGFRKGHVPAPVLEKHLGTMAILSEMAERAIAHAYPHIIEAHQLDAIGQPQIEVTKIAPENPLGFTITVSVIPQFTLPDYEQIARTENAKRPTDTVTDEEVTAKIHEIQMQKRAYERMQQAAQENKDGELPTPESEAKTAELDADAPLPPLTDEYVRSLGQPGQFATVDDFTSKLREHLEIEKQRDNAVKHRAALTDAIIAATTITLPRILIDSELNQMWAQMEDDLGRADLKVDDYLTHIKKTKEELRSEWQPAAEKRARLQLVLNEIAKQAKITPDADTLNSQVTELMTRFKDADEYRVRLYVASVLTNEAVMKMLEELR